MTQLTKFVNLGLAVILLCLMVTASSEAKIFEWPDSTKNGEDLLLLGFGELTTHYMSVSGNDSVFESSNPSLSEDFKANYRLSLFANGNVNKNFLINGAAIVDSRIGDEYQTLDPSVFRLKMSVQSTEPIWDGWRFTGRGVYDPNREWELSNLDTRLLTQPQEPSRLELLMRLESDEYGYIEGGSLRPSFKDAKFTLHQRSIFGAYTDLHSGPVGVEAVGGKLEGRSIREGDVVGVRADGTSGPYDLTYTPVTVNSEEVKVETRDRFDETTVISSKTLTRDIDYTVDYLLGRVLLHQPVSSETASGDPIYIVITYDYQRDENDDIMGGRVKLSPDENVQVSGSYLHRNIDNEATIMDTAIVIGEPEDLVAGDINFKTKYNTTGYAEVAGSQNPDIDDNYSAVRFGGQTEFIENLVLKADFQRIDDQFNSFTNSDLNPNKNQQRINLGGDYKLTETQKVNASYLNLRGLEANGDFNTYDGLREEKVIKLGYRNDLQKSLGFGVGFERRDIKDRENANHEDTYQNRALAKIDGELEDFFVLGKVNYGVDYELIMFRNDLNIGDNDANTNQIAFTFGSKPRDNATIKLAHRFLLRKDRVLDLYDQRQDATFGSLQYRPHKNVNTLTTFEYKRYTVPGTSVKFWQDDPAQVDKAGTFAIEYLPLDKIKAVGKAGRHQSNTWANGSSTNDTKDTKDFLLGQVTYFHTHHLSFNVESEYTREETKDSINTLDKTWDLGIRMNWNKDRLNEFTAGLIRRWESKFTSDYLKITSPSYIALINGSISLSRYIFARGAVKGILLDVINDEKTFVRLEVGYDSNSWYRVSLGYERIEGSNDDDSSLDYTGQGVFLRLTGKM